MYGAIGLVALLETHCQDLCIKKHGLLLFLLFMMSFIIEVLQATCVASRSAEWLDLLANFFGLTGGYLAYRLLRLVIS